MPVGHTTPRCSASRAGPALASNGSNTEGGLMAQDIVTHAAAPEDGAEIQALHASAFGPGRFARTAYRLREGMPEFSPFCRVCRIDGRLAAAVRFTPILVGGRGGALLLGPLAVDPAFANQGHGRGLVGEALEAARAAGIAL